MKAIQADHFETSKFVHHVQDKLTTMEEGFKVDKKKHWFPMKDSVDALVKNQEDLKRVAKIEANQDEMSTKLDAIATSLELITLALIPDDVKKGERVVSNVKCRDDQVQKKDDEAGDGGSSRSRQPAARARGGGRSGRGASGKSAAPIHYAQSGLKGGSQVKSTTPMIDEEFARQAFLEENKGADFRLLAEEEEFYITKHKQDLEAGLVQQVEDMPRPKLKAIQIKEAAKPDQSLPSQKVYSEDEYRSKGKGKVDEHLEQGMLKPIRATSDRAQVAVQIGRRSTTDGTQVDQNKVEKSISGRAQIDLIKKQKIAVDKAQADLLKSYKPSTLPDEMRTKFSSKPVLHHQEEITKENPAKFAMRQKVAGDKGGLGSYKEQLHDTSHVNTRDPSSLAEPKKRITQKNLDKLESAEMVRWKSEKKDILLYFLTDGNVFRVTKYHLHLKLDEELEYVIYIMRVRNQASFQCINDIREILANRKIRTARRLDGPYVPKYVNVEGKEIEMKRNNTKFQTVAGVKVLIFNEESATGYHNKLGNQMARNDIYSLRSTIYQTGDTDPELSMVKNEMLEALVDAEKRLLKDYLRTQWDLEEIQ